MASYFQQDIARSIDLYTKALKLFRKLGDTQGTGWALMGLGIAASYNKNYDDAQALKQEALALFRSLDYAPGTAFALNSIGVTALIRGYYEQPEVALEGGYYEQAEIALEECLAVCRLSGQRRFECFVSLNLGLLALSRKDIKRAEALAIETLKMASQLGFKVVLIDLLSTFAGIAVANNLPERGLVFLTVLTESQKILGILPHPISHRYVTDLISTIREQLSEKTFAVAYNRGKSLALETVIQELLEEPNEPEDK